jgi:hypothetical protein
MSLINTLGQDPEANLVLACFFKLKRWFLPVLPQFFNDEFVEIGINTSNSKEDSQSAINT